MQNRDKDGFLLECFDELDEFMTTSWLLFASYWNFTEGNSSLILLIEDYHLILDESWHELCKKFSTSSGLKLIFLFLVEKLVTAGYGYLKLAKFNNFGVVPNNIKQENIIQ